ncbi:MAG: hypothetical protein SGCHY_004205 [Lobulomycetales sp.]
MIKHALLAAVAFALHGEINRLVRQPYMDELFHVPQLRRFCAGDFDPANYDPKLTTPPGLYLISRVWHLLLPCDSLPLVRAVNLVFLFGALALMSPGRRSGLVFFPPAFFFYFLYYTDAASTFFILLAYQLLSNARYSMAALACVVATMVRQTNIVWALFIALLAGTRIIDGRNGTQFSSAPLSSFTPATFPRFLLDFVWSSIVSLPVLLRKLWAFLALFLGFALFLLVNRGIVLGIVLPQRQITIVSGDRENHVASLHLVHVLYFAVILFGFTLPVIRLPRALRSPFLHTLALTALALVVHKYTIEHPFLLSDNRHYTFYIWRYAFRLVPWLRYAAVPVYSFCLHLLVGELHSVSALTTLFYAACVAITLVPSPLLEFRYYVIPYYLYRLQLPEVNSRAWAAEQLLFAAVNAFTFGMFLYRPFEWPSEPGVEQRFMW